MLFYRTFGSPSAKLPSLIFLHGFLGSHADWGPIADLLKDRYFGITIDLPSHGNSPVSDNLFASLETTLLSISQETPFVLIGYSLGGRLAFRYGQKYPHALKALVALSAHIGLKSSQEQEKRQAQDLLWQERLLTLSPQEFLPLWYKQAVFSSLHRKPKLLDQMVKSRASNQLKPLASVLEQASLSKQPFYKNFPFPACFLCGEEDPAYVSLYQTHFGKAAKVISNAGHTVHLENPLECARAIDSFLSSLF